MADKKVIYDESKIQTLSSLEHIRKRSGMYIGRLGNGSNPDDGIYVLLKEVIDNSVDEFIMGAGKRIVIEIKDNKVKIRDYGRGIPLGKVVDCVSIINTGGKFNDDVFQFSVGLNGVGTKAVNALSSYFRVVSIRDGHFHEAIFEKGKLVNERQGSSPKERNGVFIEFVPDEELFGEYTFNFDFVKKRLWNYAYLNKGLTLTFDKETFYSEKGLYDLLKSEVGDNIHYNIVYFQSDKLEVAFTHTPNYGETYFSFVNGQYTSDGGTHLSAFKEGLLKGINEYYKTNYSGTDVRESIAGCISIKLKDPVFESQTKNKLGNTEIRSWIMNAVKEGVEDYLHKNVEDAKKLQDIIVRNEKLRKELSEVKKNAKEASNRTRLNIEKLRDCRWHLHQDPRHAEECEASMIFLTEGDSASGTITKTRDVKTQAVFSLRGKVKNVEGEKRTIIYKTEELFNIMKALGIEDGMDGLRYGKVVIATDADDDGYHIRILLMTYFLTFFEELVTSGRLYILETPLFRVRNRQEVRYCYNEKERDKAMKEIRGSEVTRFKGLGEIDPKEFGAFIGKDIKLIPVTADSIADLSKTMEFYMGDNTPERRDFIMQYLLPEEEV